MLAAIAGIGRGAAHHVPWRSPRWKWCGVVYLLYMAWQALRETGVAVDRHAPGGFRRAPAGASS